MHEHEVDVGPHGVKARGDRLLACVTAGHDAHEVVALARRRPRVGEGIADPLRRRDDDDLREGTREHAVEGVAEDRVIVEPDERLRRRTAQAHARSGRHHDDREAGHGQERIGRHACDPTD